MNITLKSVLLSSCVALTGCLATTTQPTSVVTNATPLKYPVCSTSKQCDAMWLAAKKYLQEETTLSLELDSKDLIQTYKPHRPPFLSASAERRPNPDGTYTIIGKFTCLNSKYCSKSSTATSLELFNIEMQLVGKKFGHVSMMPK